MQRSVEEKFLKDVGGPCIRAIGSTSEKLERQSRVPNVFVFRPADFLALVCFPCSIYSFIDVLFFINVPRHTDDQGIFLVKSHTVVAKVCLSCVRDVRVDRRSSCVCVRACVYVVSCQCEGVFALWNCLLQFDMNVADLLHSSSSHNRHFGFFCRKCHKSRLESRQEN